MQLLFFRAYDGTIPAYSNAHFYIVGDSEMKKYEAGFIGAGNMGGALALAAMKKVGEDKVAVACSSEESTAAKAAKLGCAAAHAVRVCCWCARTRM